MNPEGRPRERLIEIAARSADRLTGPASRRVPIDPSAISRMLVIKPCCLGDVLMATPALRALRRAFPKTSIHMLTTEWCAPALIGNPNVTSTFRYPDKMTTARYALLARRLRDRHYDAGVCLDRSPLVNGLLLLAGIPIRAGIDSAGRGIGLTHRVTPQPDMHVTELYLAVAESIGASPVGSEPEYHPSEQARTEAKQLLNGLRDPIVVIHPGGAVNPGVQMLSKRWPAIMFGELASSLIQDYQASVVVIGAESDRDAVQTSIDFTDGTVTNLCRRLSIDEVGAVCEQAQLYIGNDSGMSHLAAAVGAATITIFGPTSPERYRPLGPRAEVCASATTQRSHAQFDLRNWHGRADAAMDISAVTVDEVLAACARALGPTPEIGRS